MPETWFTEFPALSVDPFGLHRRPVVDYFNYLLLKNRSFNNNIFSIFLFLFYN